MEPPSVFVGIDPGIAGGIAIIDNAAPTAIPMPATARDIYDILEYHLPPSDRSMHCSGVVERVTASPQMGVTSAFTFGQGYGALCAILTALRIPFEEARPQVWQKAIGITPRRKEESQPQFKARLRVKAQQLFPSLSIWAEPKSKGKQMAIADALLIAHYCKRLHIPAFGTRNG